MSNNLTKSLQRSNARFRAAIDALAGILWTTDKHGSFVDEQPGWERITGHTWETYKGWGWGNAIHKDDIERVKKIWQNCIENLIVYNTEYRIINSNGESRLYSACAIPIIENNEVVEWVGVNIDIENQKRIEIALATSEYRAHVIIETSPTLMWMNNTHGQCILMNEAFRNFTGKTVENFNFSDIIHPDDVSIRDKSRENIKLGKKYVAEFRIKDASGQYKWLDTTVTPVHEEGRIFSWIGNGIDINDKILYQREIERQLKIQRELLSELNHRVRNTLAIIQSMVRSTLRQTISPEEFRKTFEGRLTGLTVVHDILVARNWQDAVLADIIRAELRPHVGEHRWTIPSSQVLLTATQATAFGLLIHELTTNALQYGSLSFSNGTIDIQWAVKDGKLNFYWREIGGPIVLKPEKKGYGIRLIEGIGKQLLGNTKCLFEEDGFCFELVFPVTVESS